MKTQEARKDTMLSALELLICKMGTNSYQVYMTACRPPHANGFSPQPQGLRKQAGPVGPCLQVRKQGFTGEVAGLSLPRSICGAYLWSLPLHHRPLPIFHLADECTE